MGCGSILGDLFYLTDTLLDSQRPLRNGRQVQHHTSPVDHRSLSTHPSAGEDLMAQLYNMYGEGQISEEVFSALKILADRGQLRQADLAVHRVRARHHRPHKKNVEVANALRGIRSRLTQLERTRETSAGVLADLEARLDGLNQRMMDKEQAARQAIAQDDDIARQRLAEKAELESSYERLSSQAQALGGDLARLDDLQIQLEAKKAELEALQARGELAESINQE
ncbi:MAG: hypothetical protein PVG32_11070 [Anaerolineales bacterium]|jgi:hypothetical protein